MFKKGFKMRGITAVIFIGNNPVNEEIPVMKAVMCSSHATPATLLIIVILA